MAEATPTPIMTGPDAELLAVLAKFDALTQTFEQIMARPGYAHPHQAEIDEIETAQEALVGRVCELRAGTLEGFLAREWALARYDRGFLRPAGSGTDPVDKMVAALVRDLVGREFAAAVPPAAIPQVAP